MKVRRARVAESSRESQIGDARRRLQILDGLVRALEDPHALLDVLAGADDVEEARQALQAAFELDEIQATAVLDLQFRRVSKQQLQGLRVDRDEVAAVLADLTASES